MSAMKPVSQVGCALYTATKGQYSPALYAVVFAGVSQEQYSDLKQSLLVLSSGCACATCVWWTVQRHFLTALAMTMSCVPAVNRHWTRLDVIKHAITNFLHAKRWTSPAHRFGLISVQQVKISYHSHMLTRYCHCLAHTHAAASHFAVGPAQHANCLAGLCDTQMQCAYSMDSTACIVSIGLSFSGHTTLKQSLLLHLCCRTHAAFCL